MIIFTTACFTVKYFFQLDGYNASVSHEMWKVAQPLIVDFCLGLTWFIRYNFISAYAFKRLWLFYHNLRPSTSMILPSQFLCSFYVFPLISCVLWCSFSIVFLVCKWKTDKLHMKTFLFYSTLYINKWLFLPCVLFVWSLKSYNQNTLFHPSTVDNIGPTKRTNQNEAKSKS